MSLRRRRVLMLLGTAAASALAVSLVAGPAAAGRPAAAPASPAPAGYLALGDSVPDGYDVPAGAGFVELLGAQLSPAERCGAGQAVGCRVETRNLAVSGAEVADLIAGQLPAAEALLRSRNGNATPVDDVRLVTVTIGGNDVVNPVVAACAGGNPACVPTVVERMTYLREQYGVVLERLRAAAGPGATIAAMGYYNALLPPCPYAGLPGLAELAPVVLEGGIPGVPSLNGTIRDAAAAEGATYVPTADVIGSGELSGDCLHPNAAGHLALAERFAETVGISAFAPSSRR